VEVGRGSDIWKGGGRGVAIYGLPGRSVVKVES
jgi:hypothetical protein